MDDECAIQVEVNKRYVLSGGEALLPRYLFISLQLFRATAPWDKLNSENCMSLPLPLLLTFGDRVYELFVMIIHTGENKNSGHYYTYCKKMLDDGGTWWILINDAHVNLLGKDEVPPQCMSNAREKNAPLPYLVAYKKC